MNQLYLTDSFLENKMENKPNLEKMNNVEEITIQTEYGIEHFLEDLFKGNLGSVKNRTYKKLMKQAEEKEARIIELIQYGPFMSGTAWDTHCGFTLTARLYK